MEPAFIQQYPPHEDDETYKEQIIEFRQGIQQYYEQYQNESYMTLANTCNRFVVRFLKARKFKVHKSVTMFGQALELRVKYDLDHILDTPVPAHRVIADMYPQCFQGFAQDHTPIYMEFFSSLRHDLILDTECNGVKLTDEDLLHYHRWCQEFMHRKICSMASERAGRRVDKIITIVNIKNVGYSNLCKPNYRYLKAIAEVDSICYPETLLQTWIVNAGMMFKIAYAVVKPFLDQGTTDKFHIISGDGAKEMREALGAENLPVSMGGTYTPQKYINFHYTQRAEGEIDNNGERPAATEVVEAENTDRVTELEALTTAEHEDKWMWTRMGGSYADRAFYLMEHGLAAYEAKYEAGRLEEINRVRRIVSDVVTESTVKDVTHDDVEGVEVPNERTKGEESETTQAVVIDEITA